MPFRSLFIALSIPFILMSSLTLLSGQVGDDGTSLGIMTYNIRYNNPGDGVNAWPRRCGRVIALIRKYHPDILGIQEGLKGQVDDLTHALTDYEWFGVGRDDGRDSGEFSAIFYRNDRFERLDGSTFWLSKTPNIPGSRGWDAACNRIVTWVELKEIKSGKVFYVFNTHFDHVGRLSQYQSAWLLLEKIKDIAGGHPVIATGDFNAGHTSEAYKILTACDSTCLRDARNLAKNRSGPEYTYIGFSVKDTPGETIDHIFITPDWTADSYGIISDSKNGFYPSDHLPVLVRLRLPLADYNR